MAVFPFSFSVAAAQSGSGPAFVPGALPSDGFLAAVPGGTANGHEEYPYLVPTVTPGQRLTGTVSIGVSTEAGHALPPGNPATRLLLDGVPITAWGAGPWPIDTTQFADGSHALGAQFQSQPVNVFGNSSVAVVVNNSVAPIKTLLNQAICGVRRISQDEGGLAWGRTNVQPLAAYPRDPTKGNRPVVPNSADQATLATGTVWWIQSAFCRNASLYHHDALLMLNEHGDQFIHRTTPNGPLSDTGTPINAAPAAWMMPQFDGSRGLSYVSPYSTVIPDVVPDPITGKTGWLGVDLSGRLFKITLGGADSLRVDTIWGPRSVAGKVQTYPTVSITLDQRVDRGEKEYVGDYDEGGDGVYPDLSLDDTNSDQIMLADTLNGLIRVVSRSGQNVVSTTPAPGITSIWCGFEATWTTDGAALRKNGAAFASIPRAGWVRGDPVANVLYVLTSDVNLYSVDATSGATTLLTSAIGGGGVRTFVFLYVDIYGTMGQRGSVYVSDDTAGPGNISVYLWTPGATAPVMWAPALINRLYSDGVYQYQAIKDPLGHYPWLLCGHPTYALVLSAGTANQGWHLLTGYLGAIPTFNHPGEPNVGSTWNAIMAAWPGVIDVNLGPSTLWGAYGDGTSIGYDPRQYRGMTSTAIAVAMEAITPGWGAMAPYLWGQTDPDPF